MRGFTQSYFSNLTEYPSGRLPRWKAYDFNNTIIKARVMFRRLFQSTLLRMNPTSIVLLWLMPNEFIREGRLTSRTEKG